MADPTIFSNPFFSDFILPFLLLFVVIFAILDKSKILGDGKKQINALTSLVISLIAVSFGYSTGVIVKLIPFLAIAVVVILVFMLLMGFVASGEKGYTMPKGLKITFGILIGVALIGVVLWATGFWQNVSDLIFSSSNSRSIWLNVLFLALIGGAVAVVLATTKNTP